MEFRNVCLMSWGLLSLNCADIKFRMECLLSGYWNEININFQFKKVLKKLIIPIGIPRFLREGSKIQVVRAMTFYAKQEQISIETLKSKDIEYWTYNFENCFAIFSFLFSPFVPFYNLLSFELLPSWISFWKDRILLKSQSPFYIKENHHYCQKIVYLHQKVVFNQKCNSQVIL